MMQKGGVTQRYSATQNSVYVTMLTHSQMLLKERDVVLMGT